jgi:hypothetical protein
MTNNEFWSYVNDTMKHLLLPRARWERINNFLKWVGSVNLWDYTEARKAFDSCVMGK